MPNRVIKEEIRTSRKVNNLSDLEFRLWIYLITYADDFGRGSADPELLRGILFPRRKGITEAQIQTLLDSLANTGMVILYTVDGEPYFYFPNWGKHQRIQAKKSRFPAPEEGEIAENHGSQPLSTVNHGESPPKYNPIQSESNPSEKARARTHTRGEFGWVKLTDEQYEKLVKDLGKAEADRCIRYVDEAAQQTGNKNKWKDWNLTVRKCSRDGWGRKGEPSAPPKAAEPKAPKNSPTWKDGPTYFPDRAWNGGRE